MRIKSTQFKCSAIDESNQYADSTLGRDDKKNHVCEKSNNKINIIVAIARIH